MPPHGNCDGLGAVRRAELREYCPGVGCDFPDGAYEVGVVGVLYAACHSLTVLSRLQTSRYDQAYFYGCRNYGNWGFMDYETKELNKSFYAMKVFGEIKKGSADVCESASTVKDLTAFAAKSADGAFPP